MQSFFLVVVGFSNGSFGCVSRPDHVFGCRPQSIFVFGIPMNKNDRELLENCRKIASAAGIQIQFKSHLDNKEEKV